MSRFALVLFSLMLVACTTQNETSVGEISTADSVAAGTTTPSLNATTTRTMPSEGTLSTAATGSGLPVSSSALSVSPDGKLVAVVNPDSDSITLLDAITLTVVSEIAVGDDPRTLSFTPNSQKVLVANRGSATLSIVNVSKHVEVAQYPVGPDPYGVITDGANAYVAEFALGEVAVIDLEMGAILNRVAVDPFPAGLALSPDGQQLFVTHFFDGSLTVIDLQTHMVHARAASGTGANLSQFVAISPDGRKAYLPQTRSNVTNTARSFDTTVFPIVNVFEIADLHLSVKDRITLDTADEPVNMPFSVALSPDGTRLYVSNAGSNDVSAIDLTNNKGIAHISVGSNPRGIAITPNGARLFVNNVLDGTISVIETDTFEIIDHIKVTDIPLSQIVLAGKKIFNSASSPALTTDDWISCATCHFDGTMDARTWLGFPDGPRNTPALFGVAQTLPIHWSGDFDELHDVEITIKKIQFGNGLVAGKAHDSLGPPHSDLSPELDALAAYLASIQGPTSPYRGDREAIDRGSSLFGTLGCQICHTPPLYTDLRSYDVGTGDPSKEKNSHGRGTKFDTPSLRWIWLTAPYFHDGSAATLQQVLRTGTTHNVFDNIDGSDLKALIDFIRALPDSNRGPR